MKVLFDHQLFYYVYGGAPKYFAMLLNNMPRGSWDTTSLFPLNSYIKELGLFKIYDLKFRGQLRITEKLNQYYTNFKLRQGDFDIFHQTNFGTYCIKSAKNKPFVTTFHDVNFSTNFPNEMWVERQRQSLERADAIICVSENTKRDMLHYFDVDESKAHVIHHGVEIPDLSKLDQRRIYDFPYILYVGVRLEYKNFKRFVEAFSLIHRQYPEIKVVCTSFPFTVEEHELFHKYNIKDSVVHITASEPDMKRLYRDALFFIYPSLYEGFGMPILEAWACHCPVALADASCFPEVAQDGGLYFDPMEVEDIAAKMDKLIGSEQLRSDLIAKGNHNLTKYSWKQCAEEHMKVYKSLL